MAHESFEDDRVAALLNRHFVPVKVDREERPDVDRVYMTFVQATTGAGGWPMSVWLTPDLQPFYGGTYFPPTGQRGRPGFADVLEELGYASIEAPDGPTALRILESEAAVDLLISDVGLPGGINGRQLADAARVTRPELKVLFITGYAENAIIGNGQLAPGMRVLTKPFVVETLATRIYDMIGEDKKRER